MNTHVFANKVAADHVAHLMDEAQRERMAREARDVQTPTPKRRKHFRPTLRPALAHR